MGKGVKRILTNLRYTLLKYEPLLEFANMMNYSAMGLGNHDFDDGVEGIVPFIEEVGFPVLASNIVSHYFSEIYL